MSGKYIGGSPMELKRVKTDIQWAIKGSSIARDQSDWHDLHLEDFQDATVGSSGARNNSIWHDLHLEDFQTTGDVIMQEAGSNDVSDWHSLSLEDFQSVADYSQGPSDLDNLANSSTLGSSDEDLNWAVERQLNESEDEEEGVSTI